MTNIWERFNEITNKEEVAEARSAFEPAAEGICNAVLISIEPSENSTGLPMVKGKFKTVEDGKYLFYNQNLQNLNYPNMTAVNIAEAVTFIGALKGEEIEFTNLGELAEIVTEIEVGGTYIVDVSYGNKDFDHKFAKLKIKGIVEEDTGDEVGEDVEL